MKKIKLLLIACLSIGSTGALSGGGVGSQPVGTGFNYQGELLDNGQVVNTPRVLTFELFDAAVAGNQLGITLEYGTTIFPGDEPGYPVTNGLFFIEDLNFGDQYNGEKAWLQITVRTPDLENCGTPNPPCTVAEVLSPRQLIKAVPYAVQADYLGPIGASNGDVLTFDGDEWVPESSLTQPWSFVSSGGINYIRYLGGDIRVINGGASIGSGNNPPLNGLDVIGDVMLHKKLNAPESGDADMKAYIYGAVNAAGNIVSDRSSGGFTVSKTSIGKFKIDFTGPSIAFNYIAFAIKDTSQPNFTTTDIFSNTFNVYMYDIAGSPVDDTFSFVVYKK